MLRTKRECYLCGSSRETRPYGPDRLWVCWPCRARDPKLNKICEAVFAGLLQTAKEVSIKTCGKSCIVLTQEGPKPGFLSEGEINVAPSHQR